MLPTTTVNALTVVHKESGGVALAFPDVCRTPSPGGGTPVPIPYPNIARSTDLTDGTVTVKIDGKSVAVRGSNISRSTGDEPGTLRGLLSNQVMGRARPLSFSADVLFDGDYPFRLFDLMLQNSGSPANTPPGILLQAAVLVPILWLEPARWTVKWSKAELKCGDDVEIEVTDLGGTAGNWVSLTVARAPFELPISCFLAPIAGGVTKIPWVTETGLLPEDPVQLDLLGFGVGDYATAASPLTIRVPAETKKAGAPQVRVVPQFSQVVSSTGVAFIPTGAQFSWDYGYDLELKNGVFKVTGKIKLVAQQGATVGEVEKRGWKAEIEGFWNRKFREHRSACRRGKECRCWGGCCLFPIVVECLFVDGGEFATVNVWGGDPCTYGHDANGEHVRFWDAANWFMGTCADDPEAGTSRAHEFGHALGLYDEYIGGANYVVTDRFGNVVGAPPYEDVTDSIMGHGTVVYENHFEEFHNWFLSVASDAYELQRL